MKTTIEKIAARVASAIALFAISATRQVQASDWTDSTDSTITYTALKTIKGDGSAYVITDIVPTLTDVVKMRFKTRNATLNANETLFCARQGFKNKSFGAMIADSGKLRIDRGDQAEQYSSSALAKNTEYLMTINYGDGNKNTTVTLNDSAFALAGNLVATSDNPTSGLVLFALNNNQVITSGYRGQHYLYYFELYDSSGNLKNCLMPAQRDSDSVVGLYDTKSGKFYPQAGGTFTTAARTVTGQGVKWIGRGSDNKMSTVANWEGGVAPQEGDEIDFTLAPPLATIVADIDATFGKVWIGDGVITFTNALVATSFNDTSKIVVDANSTVTIDGDLEFSGSVDEYIVNYVAAGGRFVVSGDIKAMPGKTSFVYPCVNHNQFKGTIVAKGLVNNSGSTRVNRFALTRGYADTQVNWAVGKHGISGTDGFWKPNGGTIQSTITAEADFRISSEIAIQGPLTLDTKTHTIEITGDTARRGICGSGSNSGTVTITGAGRVVADYDVNNLTSKAAEKSNPFTVLDTATLAVKPGSNLGTGQVSVTNGATLAICESGTVTLNGGLTLDDGATLAFNFTDWNTTPQLALSTGKTLTASGAVNVKISGEVWPKSGEHILTTCGGFTDGNVALAPGAPNWARSVSVDSDGNIVLDVKSPGMVIKVK